MLWLTVVAAAFVIAWQNFVSRGALELENRALRSQIADLETNLARKRG